MPSTPNWATMVETLTMAPARRSAVDGARPATRNQGAFTFRA
jgi:hypothetical protein